MKIVKVVAANDAPDDVKAQADYVCDGVNDEVEIQAAIDAVETTNEQDSHRKGWVELREME